MTTRLSPPDAPIIFDRIMPALISANTKQMIRLVAHELAKNIGIKERILADRMSEKEKEHPSAMGDGIAIMHLHISGLKQPFNTFVRLKNPINMYAADNKVVDLVCIMMTPEREGSSYLRSMARLSRTLRNEQTCIRLRAAVDERSIRNILEQQPAQKMAA